MDLAVIKTGGKQYIVSPGKEIKIEKVKEKKQGDKIAFDQVLLYKKGKQIKIGSPFVKGAKAEGEIIEQGRAKKITILKYKSKTRRKIKRGHRRIITNSGVEISVGISSHSLWQNEARILYRPGEISPGNSQPIPII